jgi:hypothetical protein
MITDITEHWGPHHGPQRHAARRCWRRR